MMLKVVACSYCHVSWRNMLRYKVGNQWVVGCGRCGLEHPVNEGDEFDGRTVNLDG